MQFSLKFSLSETLTWVVLLGAVATPALAQHTVVQDAGGGRKIELQYNAAGQVTETRTLGPDGKLQQKDTVNYPPGAYVPDTTSTTYWPTGQVQKLTRNTFDNNANFTGEFVQVFDESGKQTAGHRLTHDPQTGVYRCFEWSTASQDYKQQECPAAEESSGAPEEVKKFTAQEVGQQLEHAREAARQPQKTEATTSAPGQPVGTNVKEVGLALPMQIRPGQRVSGSVVEDPGKYEGTSELMVTRIALPFTASGEASTLAGWTLDMSGEPPQRADGPIALTVPPGQVALAITFKASASPSATVSKAIPLPHSRSSKPEAVRSYKAPAICIKEQPCVIHGPFNGDSNKTFAAFEEQPAKVLAETSDAAYIAIPDRVDAGPRPLVIAEASKAIAFPIVVASFTMEPSRRELAKGEKILMFPTVAGPEEVPDAEWVPGNFPPSNLQEARKLVPGFQVPRMDREAHEKREAREKQSKSKPDGDTKAEEEEGGGGEVLVVIKNMTPDQVTFRDAQKGSYIFRLKADAFKRGEFRYKFVVEALKAGSFGVQGYVIPFLAPVAAQEFPLQSETSGK